MHFTSIKFQGIAQITISRNTMLAKITLSNIIELDSRDRKNYYYTKLEVMSFYY